MRKRLKKKLRPYVIYGGHDWTADTIHIHTVSMSAPQVLSNALNYTIQREVTACALEDLVITGSLIV